MWCTIAAKVPIAPERIPAATMSEEIPPSTPHTIAGAPPARPSNVFLEFFLAAVVYGQRHGKNKRFLTDDSHRVSSTDN